MNKKLTLFSISLFVSLLIFSCSHYKPGDQDSFQSFSEMVKKNKEGLDYEIQYKERLSKILVSAFHGGYVEPGSTELADEITKNKYDYYTFKALKPGKVHEPSLTSSSLHITSTRFDEPKMMSMIENKAFCLSLHGFGGKEADFCIGGANAEKRKELMKQLVKDFPDLKSCELCCPPFNGTSAKNPINKCQNQGVQVEMSPSVRKRILNDESFKKTLAKSFESFLDLN